MTDPNTDNITLTDPNEDFILDEYIENNENSYNYDSEYEKYIQYIQDLNINNCEPLCATTETTSYYQHEHRGCSQRGCFLSTENPKVKYQTQKRIQNTVRVASSLYTLNLAALNAYQRPSTIYQPVNISGTVYITSPGVNWNQMSDRREPHTQHVKTGSGSAYRCSSTRHTITRLRPGALSPGGTGVDIKHNSYDRYLNRLKGKGPIRAGPAAAIEVPVPFNRAFPVYGDKVVKTGIINGCKC